MAKDKAAAIEKAQKEAQEKHRRTVTLEELCRKESSLMGPKSTAAAGHGLKKDDLIIREQKKVHTDKFVPDFDEDEVPDLI